MIPSADPPAGIAGDPAGEVETDAPEPSPVGPAGAARERRGAPRRRASARKPGERRVQILQTLATMLEQPGAERITTAALAARLDVSEAALYRHFASKAQMFEGLIEFIEQSVFTLVNQIAEREPDPARRRRSAIADGAAAVRREEPGHDAGDGRRRAGVRERAPAGAHEPVLRPRSSRSCARACAPAPRPRARPRRRSTPAPRPRCSPRSPSAACSATRARVSEAAPPSTSTRACSADSPQAPSLVPVDAMPRRRSRPAPPLRSLLPERRRSIAAGRGDTLLVADAHIGKAVSFRALGVPVPRGTTSRDARRPDRRWRAHRRAADRLPRRLPAFGARRMRRPRCGGGRLARRAPRARR